mmetsp:Transcript_33201/g.78417  ORF Transcript_33201/g.78417 Transcript_33201/m.78417 type:complete len:101 (-) Transcript_33201:372-674(-)
MTGQEMRVQVKRSSEKKSGYAVEKRSDGFYYVISVPPKKSGVKPGDRVLEINGIKYTEFQSAKKANKLFDTFVLDVEPESESEDESSSESESESDDSDSD